jgi:hypothetical protein
VRLTADQGNDISFFASVPSAYQRQTPTLHGVVSLKTRSSAQAYHLKTASKAAVDGMGR